MMDYDRIMTSFLAYAKRTDSLRAAVVIGSRARSDRPADRYSDLDMILVFDDARPFIQFDAWLEEIGPYSIAFVERTVDGAVERRVMFDEAIEVDFVLRSKSEIENPAIASSGLVLELLGRGYKVIVDKGGYQEWLDRILSQGKKQSVSPPDMASYLNTVHNFWYHVVWTAKKLRRGEIWSAKQCLDCYMKRLLLQMIEWHAIAVNGWDYDTWHEGRFLDSWAEDIVKEKITETFGTYHKRDLERALQASADLYSTISTEVAEKLGYSYPHTAKENALRWSLVIIGESE